MIGRKIAEFDLKNFNINIDPRYSNKDIFAWKKAKKHTGKKLNIFNYK